VGRAKRGRRMLAGTTWGSVPRERRAGSIPAGRIFTSRPWRSGIRAELGPQGPSSLRSRRRPLFAARTSRDRPNAVVSELADERVSDTRARSRMRVRLPPTAMRSEAAVAKRQTRRHERPMSQDVRVQLPPAAIEGCAPEAHTAGHLRAKEEIVRVRIPPGAFVAVVDQLVRSPRCQRGRCGFDSRRQRFPPRWTCVRDANAGGTTCLISTRSRVRIPLAHVRLGR
jgi:hypothetical protein